MITVERIGRNAAKNMVGIKCGRLVPITRTLENGPSGTARWLCICDCGNETTVLGTQLRNGAIRSCGCLRDEVAGRLSTKHGQHNSPEYIAWSSMHQRCTNPKNPRFIRYGARGISVCARWQVFQNFFADMGARPHGLSIDRINNDGDYCPENCKWSTNKEQMNNMSRNKRP